MKQTLTLALILFQFQSIAQTPVLKNPGIPANEHFTISDHLDDGRLVTAEFQISLNDKACKKFYNVTIKEGDAFLNEIVLNYDDLTSVSEKRTDLKKNKITEDYIYEGNNKVYYYFYEKSSKTDFSISDNNIYSRYAYFISFRGFPFGVGNSAYFKTFMYEIDDEVPMKLICTDRLKVQVKAGCFDCYKLELSVAGWWSLVARNKFYLYFTADALHRFIKYEEKGKDGNLSNELIEIK